MKRELSLLDTNIGRLPRHAIRGHFGNRRFAQTVIRTDLVNVPTNLIEPLRSRLRPTLRDGH